MAFLAATLLIVLFSSAYRDGFRSPRPKLVLDKALCNLDWSLGNSACGGQSFFASLMDHEPKIGPERCHCPGTTRTLAGSWNNCISCLYVTFLGMHNGLARELEGGSSQEDFTTTAAPHGLHVRTNRSSLDGYEDHAQVTPDSGGICINLHQSRKTESPTRVKALLHLDSRNCPGRGTRGAHAVAMKLDFNFSNQQEQTAEFFHTGEYESNGFDVQSNDNDDIFYLKLRHHEEGNRTTAWAYRISKQKAWKFYLDGVDDDQFFIASQFDSDPQSPDLGLGGMSAQCVNDADDKTLDFEACEKKGFGFQEFPVPLKNITHKRYPTWTPESLRVERDTTLHDYFK